MPPFENDELSIPYDRFNNLEVFFNLGYNVNKNFLSKFSDEVIKVDGLKMLITQAVASFNIWTDSEINIEDCLLYTSPSPRDSCASRMPSSA